MTKQAKKVEKNQPITFTWHSGDGRMHPNPVVFFKVKEPFGGLSNMASGYPLQIDDITVSSSEALYQACRFPHQPEWQQEIIIQRSPMAAKMMAKKEGRRKERTRSDWEEIEVDVMSWVLRVKLAQHYRPMSELLHSTGNRAIVEKSRKDKFWGAVEDEDGNLHGQNQLGQLLMELRELVKTQSRQELTVVEPLAIENFLLLGKPIPVLRGVTRI